MHRSLLCSLALALAGVSTAPVVLAQAECRPASALVRQLIEGDGGPGDLTIVAGYGLDEELLVDEGRLRATLEVGLDRAALHTLGDLGADALCVAVVLDVEGDFPLADQRRLELDDPGSADGWSFGVAVDLPEEASQVMVIVEEPESGLWSVAVADDLGELPRPGPTATRLSLGDAWVEWRRSASAPTRAQSRSTARAAPVVVRLIPPRRQPVTGATRFDALVSVPEVDRVVFVLDGEEVATRKRSRLLERPFAARISLADPPRRQILEAIAYDENKRELGRDRLTVNELDAPFRVRIQGLEGDPGAGAVEVAAEVDVPTDAQLDRVEIYLNQTLLESFDTPRIRYRLATPDVGLEDYVRVAAYLADGRSIDDVVLLSSPESVERVEVNLVELHVVVTDAEGRPVDDLGAEDFTIVHRGEEQPTQSFAYAKDVPLLLGLVIDTSGSMRLMMQDTGRAAVRFLGSTVLSQDRAFAVNFGRRPHLLHPTTSDLPPLLIDLTQLKAEGETAMYDAIVFSMAQFDRQGGRKALVVLTDGDDRDSTFGPRYCVDLARQAGVPIYIIALDGVDGFERSYSKRDLRKTTSESGGRLYFVKSFDQLDQAYAQINAELRSQYSLAFYTDADLDADERRDVEVRLSRPGLSARTVVGTGPPSP